MCLVHSSPFAPSECASWKDGSYHKTSRVKSSPSKLSPKLCVILAVLLLLSEIGAGNWHRLGTVKVFVAFRLGVHSTVFSFGPFRVCWLTRQLLSQASQVKLSPSMLSVKLYVIRPVLPLLCEFGAELARGLESLRFLLH